MKSTQEKYLPEFIYGAIDGLVTTFAIVSGVMGASLSAGIILILGFANVFADGFSMGASNYLSTRSEHDLQKRDNLAHSHDKLPIKTGLVTFISFIIVGTIPMTPFVFGYFYHVDQYSLFKYSIVITGFAFFIIGLFRGFITKTSPIRAGIETLFVGALAAAISYFVGSLLQGLGNI